MKIKKILTTSVIVSAFFGTIFFTACNKTDGDLSLGKTNLSNSTDSLSYSLGVMMGGNLKTQFPDLNQLAMAQAFRDVYAGKETVIEKSVAKGYLAVYSQQKKAASLAENKQKGEDFLAKNKDAEGVITLDNGLQYLVMKEGSGAKPVSTDKVNVHYHGTLLDGTVFDSSVDRKKPSSFGVTQVIKGWTQILQLMPVGSKWKVFIPSELAYGERGAGGQIGPNTALIFEIELLEIMAGENR